MRRLKMIGLTALAITILMFVAVSLKVDNWERDWTENSAAATYKIEHVSVDQIAQQVERWTTQESLWTIQEQSAIDGGIKLSLTRRTAVFRFTDDVSVLIRPADSGVSIQATSQSRLGKGDLGQNPRNLAELQKAWQ